MAGKTEPNPQGKPHTDLPPARPQAELDQLFAYARVSASRLWPYLAPAMMRLIPRWTDGHEGILTLAVDKYWRLYMCRRFVSSLDVNQLALFIAWHELQHLLMGHHYRLAAYDDVSLVDPKGNQVSLSNLAGDLAINCRLKEAIDAGREMMRSLGKIAMFPESLVVPDDGKLPFPKYFKDAAGKLFPEMDISEAYAELLYNAAKKNGTKTSHGCNCGTGGGASKESAPWEDKTPPTLGDQSTGVHGEEVEVIKQRVAEQAAEQAKKTQGTVPGHMERWAETRLTPPRVRWEEELRRVIRLSIDEIAGRTDTTFSRPNRRTAGTDVLLPGTLSYTPRVIVVLDTSGSMGPADYDSGFSEMRGLIMSKASGARGVPCIACDAASSKVQWIKNVREFKLIGGGGTDMMAGVHAAKRSGLNPGLVVILTDGYTSWDNTNPYPGLLVVAALTNRNASKPPDWIRTVYACD